MYSASFSQPFQWMQIKAASNESLQRSGATLVVMTLAMMISMYFMLKMVVIRPLHRDDAYFAGYRGR